MSFLEGLRKLAAARGGELLMTVWLDTRMKHDWR
jgi:hypothetical protein